MSPRAVGTVRHLLGTVSDAVRSVVNPAALVADQAEPATVEATEAPEPAGLFTEAELPPVADIERAAFAFDLACDSARAADRAKRKHRKLIDRLPAGTYGAWIVRRVASNRQTVDLDKVRAIFQAHGLGEVPMRDTAPSLRVERADVVPTVEDIEQLAGVAA
jgi:hypothetical protein